MLVIAVVLLICATTGSCQVFYFGPCPLQPAQRDFNPTEFMGRWYEANRTTPYYQNPLRCIVADFNRTLYGNTIQVTNSGLNFFGNWRNTEELAVTNPSFPADMEVRMNNINMGVNFKVLSTDYRTYAIVWTCSDFVGLFHTELLRIYTRAPRTDFTTLQTVTSYLNQMNINRSGLVPTNQDFCNYPPIPFPRVR